MPAEAVAARLRLGYGAARRRRKELLAFPSSTRRSPMPFRGRCRRGRAQRHPERVVEFFLFSSPTAHPPPLHFPPYLPAKMHRSRSWERETVVCGGG